MGRGVLFGWGVSTKAVSHWLDTQKRPYAVVHDIEQWQPEGGIDWVCFSPGIPFAHRVRQWARQHALPVYSECYWGLKRFAHATIIGITGSVGKTSLGARLTASLRSVGCTAAFCGNCGIPILQVAPSTPYLVVELSSFQLVDPLPHCIDVALITTIEPNHLDWHPSYTHYIETKQKIAKYCASDRVFTTSACMPGIKAPETDPAEQQSWLIRQTLGALQLPQKVAPAVSLPHRFECIGVFSGVTVINDSKATTLGAVQYALCGVANPCVLLVGGRFKGGDRQKLLPHLLKNVQHVVAYGESGAAFVEAWSHALPCTYIDYFQSAVEAAWRHCAPGMTFLFSPGCASFDMFSNYAERGDIFRALFQQGKLV